MLKTDPSQPTQPISSHQSQHNNHGEYPLNSLELIQRMIVQNTQRYEKLWEDVLKMSDLQFNQSFDPDNLSVGDHIMVVVAEYNRWLGFLKGERDTAPIRINRRVFVEPLQLFHLWSEATADMQKFIDAQTIDDLNRSAEGIQGPIWEVLIHLMMFAEEHHGYIITILAQLEILPQTQKVNRDLWHFQPEKFPKLATSNLISC